MGRQGGVTPRGPRAPGWGLAFATLRHARTGAPVGLIPSAHGGTSMQQWDPELRAQGGGSLYGATLQRIEAVGGKVAGVLWYQGESDAVPAELSRYTERMRRLVEAFRTDLGQPDLPFYYVQIGRFVTDNTGDILLGWNHVREAQRTLAATIPHTAVVSAIDLELDDAIHVGTHGLRRLGQRLADAADGHQGPDVAGVSVEGGGWRLRVTFSGVRGGLRAAGRPAGFSLRRRDEELPLIYKVTLEGDAALLHLTVDSLPRGTELWYGWGLDPYCNLTDAQDAAALAFGPITV